MIEHVVFTADSAAKTASYGQSLARSLHTLPVDILLTGTLGSGKTTFLQGFLRGCGVEEVVTSPTYALEQRYTGRNGTEIIHLDLYRLTSEQAHDLLKQTEESESIRCIEWSDRTDRQSSRPVIHIAFEEESDDRRRITIDCEDVTIPSSEQIAAWRDMVLLPDAIVRHCDAVGSFARECGEYLLAHGTFCRPNLLEAAGKLHDLFRFIDFRDGAAHEEIKPTDEELARWAEWKEQFSGAGHEEACTRFIQGEGFSAVGEVIRTHGLHQAPEEDATIEQEIVFYADKRLIVDRRVSLEGRFADFQQRYSHGKATSLATEWKRKTQEIERKLFQDSVPL